MALRIGTPIVVLIGVIVGGSILRFQGLSERSFWFDEAFSYVLIERFSWHEMIDRIGQDVHPPLYYMLLRIWSGCFGTSVVALRGLSVLLGVMTIGALYAFCREAFHRHNRDLNSLKASRGVALLAAGLLAASGVHIRWSTETRMYSLAAFLAVCSAWLLLRAMHSQDRQQWWWMGYAMAAIAILYTHNYGLFTVLGQAVFVVAYVVRHLAVVRVRLRDSLPLLSGLVAIGAVVLFYLPWLPTLLSQTRRVRQEYWVPELSFWSLPDAWCHLLIPQNSPTVPHVLSLIVTGLLAAVLLSLTVGHGYERWLVLSMVVTPVFCSFVISLVSVPIVYPRFFLPTYVFALCAIAYVLWSDFEGLSKWVVSIGLVLAFCALHIAYQTELDASHHTGVRGAVDYIMAYKRPDDKILVMHPCIYFSVCYYTQGEIETKVSLREGRTAHYKGGPILVRDDWVDDQTIRDLAPGDVWVIDTSGFGRGFIKAAIPSTWISCEKTVTFPESHWPHGDVYVTLYRSGSRDP